MDPISSALHNFLTWPHWVDLAKFVLAAIMLCASAGALIVVTRFTRWHDQLQEVELSAMHARDDFMFNMTATRAKLAEIKGRVNGRHWTGKIEISPELIQEAGSLALMLLQKEKSMLQWAHFGLRIANRGLRYFFGKRKS